MTVGSDSYSQILSGIARRRDHSSDPRLDANKRLVSRMFTEIINDRAYGVADEIFAPDFFWPQFNLRGPDGVRQWMKQFHAAFPDVRDVIEMQVAEGDMVITLLTVYGTHQGNWLGWEPTGKRVSFPAIGMDRVADGKIVERSAVSNTIDFMRAVGLTRLPDYPGDGDRFSASAP